ncbi:hypothetical protein ACI2OX_03135 [Bacillus sp. N9]
MIQEMMRVFNTRANEIEVLAAEGLPVIDNILGLPVEGTHDLNDRLNLAKLILDGVQPGKLTHFAFHPMKDTPESHGLKRYSEGRIRDYEVFMMKEMKNYMQNSGIQLIGYKDIIQYIDGYSLV